MTATGTVRIVAAGASRTGVCNCWPQPSDCSPNAGFSRCGWKTSADLIRIQDRDLAYLPAAAERQVRRAQRQYVEVWVGVLRELEPGLAESDARLMAHAVFGLLNSTPHSMKPADGKAARSRSVMRAMTLAALRVGPS
jgi:hypothetical protein